MIHGKNMRTHQFLKILFKEHTFFKSINFHFLQSRSVSDVPFCAQTDSSRQRYYPISGSLRSYCSASLFNLTSQKLLLLRESISNNCFLAQQECVLRNSQCAQKSQKKSHMKFASKAKLISLHKNYMKNLQLRLLISILAKVWAHEEKF